MSKKPSAWDLVITLQKADYPVVIQVKEDGNFEVSLKRSSCQNYAYIKTTPKILVTMVEEFCPSCILLLPVSCVIII